jgi:DNA-binding transcriptional LysR family regulator
MWGSGVWQPNLRQGLPVSGYVMPHFGCDAGRSPVGGETAIALADLQNEYFVTMPSAHSDWAFLHRVCQQAGFSPMIVREAVEPQTVLAMISMGMGITLAADSYADAMARGIPSA